MTKLTPLIFIGHGSPMNVVQNNNFTKALTEFGKTIIKPRAILVISAHWQTHGTQVTAMENPRQIYDFYGFPEELYKIKYSPVGLPELAKKISVSSIDIKIGLDQDWGIDHGAWTVLKYLFPQADVPVLQLSLDYDKKELDHLAIAKQLNSLRAENVLIIGSGNMVHNLGLISFDQEAQSTDWAVEVDLKLKQLLLEGDAEKLASYDGISENLKNLAIPTNEHYLPMLYIASLKETTEKLNWIYEGYEHGSISMRSFVIN